MILPIRLSAQKIALFLGAISAYLAVQSVIAKKIEWDAGVNNTYWLYHFVNLVNINREGNIPTWYATILLLTCALLLAVITYAHRLGQGRYVFHWGGLSLIFLYLSMDEASEIHEILTIPMQEAFDLTGYLHFGWVIGGIVFVTVIGLIYLPFVLHLSPRFRKLFILAGALYVGGAIGIESISANQWYLNSGTSLKFSAIGALEEFFEMIGAVVFIYALLQYLGSFITQIEIQLPSSEAQK